MWNMKRCFDEMNCTFGSSSSFNKPHMAIIPKVFLSTDLIPVLNISETLVPGLRNMFSPTGNPRCQKIQIRLHILERAPTNLTSNFLRWGRIRSVCRNRFEFYSRLRLYIQYYWYIKIFPVVLSLRPNIPPQLSRLCYLYTWIRTIVFQLFCRTFNLGCSYY